MMKLLSHPLYLAPAPLYARLYACDALVINGDEPFIKQTYRNRTTIATEKGVQTLTIPVIHDGNKAAMRDVRISEHGNWRHQHWNAIVSAYRKSPFFDYYADDFAHFYEEKDGFLMDFNLRLHNVTCELLGLHKEIHIVGNRDIEELLPECEDTRAFAEPKEMMSSEMPATTPYYQVFAQRNGFIPKLGIADLLFNMGPEGLLTLRDSI